MEGRKRVRRSSLVVFEDSTQLLTDKLLRTMAAVPFGQSVLVQADKELAKNLDRLGFAVARAVPGHSFADSSFEWGVVVLKNASWIESVDAAVRISRKVRDGGWIFVGTVSDSFHSTAERAAKHLLDAIGEGLAVAEEATVLGGNGDFAVSAILRRVSPATPP
ncbi:MAG: hypothetical protein KJO98_09940 [Rhodothermia bacterium]|nr:hypothetical protein [Rhodothermia bacterium]